MSGVQLRHEGERDKAPYHYTECGLDDVYLLSGYEKVEVDGEVGVAVKHADELHSLIGEMLVKERKVISGKELRFLRKYMDMTQAELGRYLGTSDQSIARWEKGQGEINPPSNVLVRVLFLQMIGDNASLRELLETLEETDEESLTHYFERHDGHWESKQAFG